MNIKHSECLWSEGTAASPAPYFSPEIEAVTLAAERGFAQSGDGKKDDGKIKVGAYFYEGEF